MATSETLLLKVRLISAWHALLFTVVGIIIYYYHITCRHTSDFKIYK